MSVNKVILVGRLGTEPETRAFPTGGTICTLRIATSESWKDRQTGERKERTEWHTVIMRGRRGEIAQQYLHKGSQVYIEGRLQTRKWQDQSGQDRYTTEIVGTDLKMLDSRPANDQNGQGGQTNDYSSAPASNAPAPAHEEDYYDDDIPF